MPSSATFLNFDLTIAPLAAGHAVQVESPNGEWTHPLDLEALHRAAAEVGEGPTLERVREWGSRLYDALFDREAQSLLHASLRQAEAQGARLRLRLRLDAPEADALSWEYLYDAPRNRFFALSPDLPLVRYLSLAQPARSLAVTPPLRALVVLANPVDMPTLDVEQEWQSLQTALAPFVQRGEWQVERLARGTIPDLQAALRRGPWHLFHFIGHGRVDPARQEGLLHFEDEQGASHPVSGDYVAMLLGGTVSLAVLNACESGRMGASSLFAGTAQRLVQSGLGAVVAMQFPIADEAAVRLSGELYRAIADGYPVDAALAEARKAIYADGVAWGTPVLYMRAADGQLFDIARQSDAEQQANQVAALWQAAQAAQATDAWATVAEKVTALLTLVPDHAEAVALHQKAQAMQEAETTYQQGMRFYEAERWRDALDSLSRVQRLAGNYKGIFPTLALLTQKLKDATTEVGKPTPDDPAQPPAAWEPMFQALLRALTEGRLVPFLGGNANLCGRPPESDWQAGRYLPSTDEVARYLAERFSYPQREQVGIVQVSQHILLTDGVGSLYDSLSELFATPFSPTPLHQFLASLPASLRAKGYPRTSDPYRQRLVLVSTTYDDMLEQSFRAVGEPFHLVWYGWEEVEAQPGKFLHQPPNGEPTVIADPNVYRGLMGDKQPVIIKLNGARATDEPNSVVITEDHFIDYAPFRDLTALLPVPLPAQLKKSSFLFLGYPLRDWYLRLILHRLGGNQRRAYPSWTVQEAHSLVERMQWGKYEVEMLPLSMERFVAESSQRVAALPPAGGPA